MAMETKLVHLVPLNGTNYATWKIQCKMALIRDGLWNIVNETEIVSNSRRDAILHSKHLSWKGRVLAMVVLSVEPLLLYLIGGPDDLGMVWKKWQTNFF